MNHKQELVEQTENHMRIITFIRATDMGIIRHKFKK